MLIKVNVPSGDILEAVSPHQRARLLAFVITSRRDDESLPNPSPSAQ